MYKVTDKWTTADGNWYVSDKKYSIDQAHVDRYAIEDIPQKGAATHLVAKIPSEAHVEIVNRYNNEVVKDFISVGVWFDFPMGKGAAYKPDLGETGPYNLLVDGVTVAEGIGLPNSWHISTWLVVEEDGVEEPEIPEELPEIPDAPDEGRAIWVQVTVDGGLYEGWLPLKGQ